MSCEPEDDFEQHGHAGYDPNCAACKLSEELARQQKAAWESSLEGQLSKQVDDLRAHLQQQAEAIERLRAERDEAKLELEKWQAEWHGWNSARSAFIAEVQHELDTQKSNAKTWQEALRERMAYFKQAEAERDALKPLATLGATVKGMRETLVEATQDNDTDEADCPCAYCLCQRILAALAAADDPPPQKKEKP